MTGSKTRITATWAAALVLGALALPGAAAASCAAHPTLDTGRYVNIDPATRSVTTVDLEFVCGSLTRDNGDGTATVIHGADPHWTIRLWGSCSPTDCDWGTARAEERNHRSVLLTRYDQGFTNRQVTLVPEAGQLMVVVTSTYSDGRSARTWVERFRPL